MPPLLTLWPARLALGGVFSLNVSCAVAFILWPERYMSGFEVGGIPGLVITRGIGILFLMWNVTYPPAIWRPWRYRDLFLVVIVQQVVGVVGETWLLLTLPPGHDLLAATGRRFILFDAGGLVALLIAYAWMMASYHRRAGKGVPNGRHIG